MAAHSSILTWRIAWTEEPGRLQSVVSQRDGHDWVWLTHFFTSSWVVVGGQESSVGRGRLQRLSFKLGSELLHFSKLEFLPGRDAREEHPVRPFGWAHAQSTHLTDLDQTVAEATGTGWTNRFPWMCSSSYFFFFKESDGCFSDPCIFIHVGCSGSSLLCLGFLEWQRAGATL